MSLLTHCADFVSSTPSTALGLVCAEENGEFNSRVSSEVPGWVFFTKISQGRHDRQDRPTRLPRAYEMCLPFWIRC